MIDEDDADVFAAIVQAVLADEAASEANKSTEAETVTKKTFRKDVNQGYSGYGNFNDF